MVLHFKAEFSVFLESNETADQIRTLLTENSYAVINFSVTICRQCLKLTGRRKKKITVDRIVGLCCRELCEEEGARSNSSRHISVGAKE